MNQLLPGDMDATEFLERYWQKQPCLIRAAVTDFQPHLTKQHLFALTHLDEVESRLIVERDGEYHWQVTHGPFCDEDFINLPQSHWTLLVQNSELHVPAAAAFLSQFDFIPNWRIDDLMISFAPAYGSVGPHLDSYDVFLFQAMGRRCWSINVHDFNEDDFIDGLDLRIIENFQAEQEWTLEPGDMLYLPPGVAHHGVAVDECMTYSIGFRAPSSHELVGNYLDDVMDPESDRRYSDPDLPLQAHKGEITEKDMHKIDALLRSALPDQQKLAEWFGRYVTRLPENYAPPLTPPQLDTESFVRNFLDKSRLKKNGPSRSAFIRIENNIILFVNARAFTLSADLEDFVCNFTENDEFDNPLMTPNSDTELLTVLLCQLYNDGLIIGSRD